MERPELRKFTGNPVATVLADRGKYIAAVLTILRAYLCAGSPSTCDPFASFEDWSRLIRSSLVWLGYADPVATTEKARADDPTRGNLQAVVAAWQNIFGVGYNQRITASKLVETAVLAGEKETDLNKALTAVATRPGRTEIDTGQLGRWLGRNKGRVTGNAKIQGEIDRHTKQVMWWLK
jgi:putative DNA primase/helicase